MDGSPMRQFEVLDFHAREGVRFRRLLANATTPLLKARLAEQAAHHERLAQTMETGTRAKADGDERALTETWSSP